MEIYWNPLSRALRQSSTWCKARPENLALATGPCCRSSLWRWGRGGFWRRGRGAMSAAEADRGDLWRSGRGDMCSWSLGRGGFWRSGRGRPRLRELTSGRSAGGASLWRGLGYWINRGAHIEYRGNAREFWNVKFCIIFRSLILISLMDVRTPRVWPGEVRNMFLHSLQKHQNIGWNACGCFNFKEFASLTLILMLVGTIESSPRGLLGALREHLGTHLTTFAE